VDVPNTPLVVEGKPATRLGLEKYGLGTVYTLDQSRFEGCYVIGTQGQGKSSFLSHLINQDLVKGFSIIVLDPHGDLINDCIAQMPESRVKDTYLLDIEDVEYPFAVNLFDSKTASAIEEGQAINRILHVFEVCFPDTSKMLLEKYLGNIAPVFFRSPGTTMLDIPRFLRTESLRRKMLRGVRPEIREFWEEEYTMLSASKQQTETASLSTRINRFKRSAIVSTIVGQGKNTLDFRRSIEGREVLLIKLPTLLLREESSLIGTMITSLIHAAIFSFRDIPREKRPGFSLFVDEFQHFASKDFEEMFTGGRKFGSRVCIAHQFREQIPEFLTSATLTATTRVAFRLIDKNAREMASSFYDPHAQLCEPVVLPDVLKHLPFHPSEAVRSFVRRYISALQEKQKEPLHLVSGSRFGVVTCGDGLKLVERLFYLVQKKGALFSEKGSPLDECERVYFDVIRVLCSFFGFPNYYLDCCIKGVHPERQRIEQRAQERIQSLADTLSEKEACLSSDVEFAALVGRERLTDRYQELYSRYNERSHLSLVQTITSTFRV